LSYILKYDRVFKSSNTDQTKYIVHNYYEHYPWCSNLVF